MHPGEVFDRGAELAARVTTSVWHARGLVATVPRRRQNDVLSVTRKLRGSTGWKWMSFTPSAGSPLSRDG